jgi:hypothetical protein
MMPNRIMFNRGLSSPWMQYDNINVFSSGVEPHGTATCVLSYDALG